MLGFGCLPELLSRVDLASSVGWSASGLLCVFPFSDFRLIYCGILTIPDSTRRGQSEGVYRNRLSEIAMNTRGAHFVCLSQVVVALEFGRLFFGFAVWLFVLPPVSNTIGMLRRAFKRAPEVLRTQNLEELHLYRFR